MISRMFSFLLMAVSLSLVSCVSTGLTQQNSVLSQSMFEEASGDVPLPAAEIAKFADSISWSPAPTIQSVARQWVEQIEAYLPHTSDGVEKPLGLKPKTPQGLPKVASQTGQRIVRIAMRYRGVAYRYGGSTPKGFDCSGFTQYVLREAGFKLPRTSREQARVGWAVPFAKAAPGDLVFFGSKKRVTHVGIIVNQPGQALTMIHSGSGGVVLTAIRQSDYWRPKLLFVKRFLK